MKTYTLNQRIRDTKRNKTLGYVLADKDGNIINVTSDQLKQAMRAGQVQVKGLTLTRDGRLFSKTTQVKEPQFSEHSNFDLNFGMQGIFDCGWLSPDQIIKNLYIPADRGPGEYERDQAKYKKYLSDMKEAIYATMHNICHCNIGGDTVNATYVLVTKKYMTDEDHVTYIQGEKAALIAYANAIVQLVKDINGKLVQELMDSDYTEEEAKGHALDSLYDIRDCVKLFIKQ